MRVRIADGRDLPGRSRGFPSFVCGRQPGPAFRPRDSQEGRHRGLPPAFSCQVSKRLLVDTTVILDVLLDRKPDVQASAALWTAIEKGSSQGMLAAHTMTTIHYLIRKQAGNTKPRE